MQLLAADFISHNKITLFKLLHISVACIQWHIINAVCLSKVNVAALWI